jgi:hypothetical protein
MKKSCQKVAPKFYCESCDYTTCKSSSWVKHLETQKHNGNKKVYQCVCGNSYVYPSGFTRHKTVCHILNGEITDDKPAVGSDVSCVDGSHLHDGSTESVTHTDDPITDAGVNSIYIDEGTGMDLKDMFMTVMKENRELRNMIIEQTKQSAERESKLIELAQRPVSTTTNTNIINNNQRVNILNYLNTECKDAMTLKDFIDSIELSMDDMYYTRDNGYVKGICNVINREMGAISYNDRPIQCADKRRLKFFVKGKTEWEKDEDHAQLNSVVDNITAKHKQLLVQWKELHPNWLEEESLQNEYLLLTSRILEGGNPNGVKNRKAIVKNLSETTEVLQSTSGASVPSSTLVKDDAPDVLE